MVRSQLEYANTSTHAGFCEAMELRIAAKKYLGYVVKIVVTLRLKRGDLRQLLATQKFRESLLK